MVVNAQPNVRTINAGVATPVREKEVFPLPTNLGPSRIDDVKLSLDRRRAA